MVQQMNVSALVHVGPSKNDLTQYLVQFQLDHYAGTTNAIAVDAGQEPHNAALSVLLICRHLSR